MHNILYWLTRFIIAIFFILLGVMAITLPLSPEMRTALISFILEESIPIILFGVAFLAIGIALLLYILLSKRRRYYTICLDTCAVDENVIRGYLAKYWHETFPHHQIPHYFTLKKKRLDIVADLPHSLQPHVELETIKNELSEIFGKLLGYKNRVTLSLSFDEQPKV